MTTSMSKLTTLLIREPAWLATSRARSQMTMSINKTLEKKQQQLAKEVFSPQITKFKRQRIIPLYKNETCSADLIDKSSLSKYNNNYKFILTFIDIYSQNMHGLFL